MEDARQLFERLLAKHGPDKVRRWLEDGERFAALLDDDDHPLNILLQAMKNDGDAAP